MTMPITNFFDSAVIIDDQLPDGYNDPPQDQELAERPLEVLRALQHSGIVVSPIPFRSTDMVDDAAALASKAKLTILDWHLTAGTDPTAAIEVLRRIIENANGMRWVVIYTREGTEDIGSVLIERLRVLWSNSGKTLLYNAAETARKLLDYHADHTLAISDVFVTYMNKRDVTAENLITRFRTTLMREFGPVSLAAFGLASEINAQSHVVLSEFAKPFDLAVRLHVLTSAMTEQETPAFLYHLYAQTLTDRALNALSIKEYQGHRLQSLKDAYNLSKSDKTWIKSVLEQLRAARVLVGLADWKWDEALGYLAEASDLAGLDLRLIPRNLQPFGVTGEDQAKTFRTVVELLCAHAEWRQGHPDAPIKDFYADLQRQTVRFTKLLKFEQDARPTPVDTGSIYEQNGQYLLCITPYCDTARPKKVDHQFKFLIGRVEPPDIGEVKRYKESDKSHGTFLPIDGDLKYVVWDLFNVRVEALYEPDLAPLQSWVLRGCKAAELQTSLDDFKPQLDTCSRQQKQSILVIAAETDDEDFMAELALVLNLIDEDGQAPAEPIHDGGIEDPLPPADPRAELRKLLPAPAIPTGSRFVAKLKREYIQQIVNKYVAYHSRAGVAELYLKEWPDQLLGVVSNMPVISERAHALANVWQLDSSAADVLASDANRFNYFEAVTSITGPTDVASLMRWINQAASNAIPPEQVAKLMQRLAEGTVTESGADILFQLLLEEKGDCDDLIAKHDLRVNTDEEYVENRVAEFLAQNQKKVDQFQTRDDGDLRPLLNPLLKFAPKAPRESVERRLRQKLANKIES